MAEPPPKPGKTEGPVCKKCGKTMKSHSFSQQLKRNKEKETEK